MSVRWARIDELRQRIYGPVAAEDGNDKTSASEHVSLNDESRPPVLGSAFNDCRFTDYDCRFTDLKTGMRTTPHIAAHHELPQLQAKLPKCKSSITHSTQSPLMQGTHEEDAEDALRRGGWGKLGVAAAPSGNGTTDDSLARSYKAFVNSYKLRSRGRKGERKAAPCVQKRDSNKPPASSRTSHPTSLSPKDPFLLAALIICRILNALSLRTYAEPDEFWQSLEVAHEHVFGYGYLTWEWAYQLRGFSHPGLFVIVFASLRALGLDNTEWLIWSPKIVQGALAGVGDFFTYKLATRIYGPNVGRWTLAASLMSWYNFMYMPRTFSNSLETVFTITGLFYWPWPHLVIINRYTNRDFHLALFFAAVASLLRPTNGIIWLFLGLKLLSSTRPLKQKGFIVGTAVTFVLFTLTTGAIIDAQFYHIWTLPLVNFIYFNIGRNISFFYGSHPWAWYFVAGVPLILHTFLPLFLLTTIRVAATIANERYNGTSTQALRDQIPEEDVRRGWPLLQLVMFTIIIYSFLSHKEARFLLPLVPVMFILVGYGLAKSQRPSVNRTRRRLVFILLFLSQAAIAFYAGTVHNRGVIDVMDYLRKDSGIPSSDVASSIPHAHATLTGVTFLMPCHSTPYYSHVHRNIFMRFVTCDPPINGPAETYKDESDIFYENVTMFIQKEFPNPMARKNPRKISSGADARERNFTDGRVDDATNWVWTSHLVLFESLFEDIKPFTEGVYHECKRFFNSHWIADKRRQGDVIVLCKIY